MTVAEFKNQMQELVCQLEKSQGMTLKGMTYRLEEETDYGVAFSPITKVKCIIDINF